MSLTIPVAELVSESDDPLLTIHPLWERVDLAAIAHILNGCAFESTQFTKDAGMPLVRIRDVGTSKTECNYDGSFDNQYVVQLGDLLIGMDGDFKCARWEGPKALLNQRVCKVVTTTRFYDADFLELALPGYLNAINENTSSQTVRHLSSRSIAEIPLPLPPLCEQRRIAAKSRLLSKQVNTCREGLAKVPKLLRAFRQSVLAAACSGRLTEDWRTSASSGSTGSAFLDEIRAVRRVSAPRRYQTDYETAPPEDANIPENWTWSALGNLTSHIGDVDHRMPRATDAGVPYISPKDFTSRGIDFVNAKRISTEDFDALARKIQPNRGDLLLSRYGTIGEVRRIDVDVKFQASYSVAIIKTLKIEDLTDWLYVSLRSPLLQAQMAASIRASSQPDLGLEYIRLLQMPVPPAPEQREITRRAKALFNMADAIESQVKAATTRVDRLTQAILAKAFRGELVPTEAELARKEGRDYEPASVLLERIKAECEKAAAKAGPKTHAAKRGKK
jgi:type I restriction enzyme S subunit